MFISMYHKMSKRFSFLIIALVLVLSILSLMYYKYPYLAFNFFQSCDTFDYLHHSINYFTPSLNDNFYTNDRIAGFFLNWAFFLVNDITIAKNSLFITKAVLLSGAVLFFLRQLFSQQTALILLALWLSSPITIGDLTTDYSASSALFYSFLSFGCLFRYLTQKRSHWFIVLSGVFFAFALHSNVKIILYISSIPLFLINPKKKEYSVKTLGKFIFGGLLATAILMFFAFLTGNDFFFFKDTILRYDADIIYRLDRINFLDISTYTNSMFLFYVYSSFMTLSILMHNKTKFPIIPVIISFTIPGFYYLLGGSIFIYSSAPWIMPVFLYLLGYFLEKFRSSLNLSKLFYTLIFIFLFSFSDYHFSFEVLQESFTWPVYFLLIVICAAIFLIRRKATLAIGIILVILNVSLIKGNLLLKDFYFTSNESMKKYNQLFKNYRRIKTFSEVRQAVFIFQNKDINNPLLGSSYLHGGCTSGSQIFLNEKLGNLKIPVDKKYVILDGSVKIDDILDLFNNVMLTERFDKKKYDFSVLEIIKK